MISEETMRQVQLVLGARGEAAVGTFSDGLQHLIVKARTGDKGARSALRQLANQLRVIDELLAVSLPGEN